MLEPAIPFDEASRIAALHGLGILDTPPEERFDRLTRLAQHLLNVPIAVVSLVDSNRQWFKSCQGLGATETPRSISFCGHAILSDEMFVIPDALEDPRFSDNPLVTNAPHIRFYAGQPVKAKDGSKVGTLCVIDSKPHQLTQTEKDNLRDLALLVENELNSMSHQEAILALLNSENRLAAVLDNILDGIITINELGIVESFNKSAVKIFGYAADEVIGQNVKLLMPEPYHGEHDGYLHNFSSTGIKKIIGSGRQVVGRRKDASIFPMDLAVSAMQLNGKRMFTGIVRDITERVANERMKREFISIVSHELRTPLTSIRGSLGLLAGGVVGELPEKARPLIEIAHKNSERLILLVNDILDMEKIEAGKMEFHLEVVNVAPVLEQAVLATQSYAEQYGVTYELAANQPGLQVYVDANRLQQVLLNLLSNAAKFSPKGDKVTLAVKALDKRVRVSVIDHGSGIPKQFYNQVFQKFAQADSSDTRKKGGTGLGLSITRAIVEQMGGKIGFDSEPGVLTTFWIEFPLRQPALKSKAGSRRVLVCEADQDIASLLRMMLEQSGLVVDVARNALEAKQLLAAQDYLAMTLDLDLPDQNGVELIRELRAVKATAVLPIIVVSVSAEEGPHVLSGEAVIDWISKPIDKDRLMAALRRAESQFAGKRARILHVEDDQDICQVVSTIVGSWADMDHAANLDEARQMLANSRYDLAILDVGLPDGSGMELLPELGSATIPVMVFSASEVAPETRLKVGASLVKARTGNAQLLSTIKRMVGIEE